MPSSRISASNHQFFFCEACLLSALPRLYDPTATSLLSHFVCFLAGQMYPSIPAVTFFLMQACSVLSLLQPTLHELAEAAEQSGKEPAQERVAC